jgi:hypothetical protein
VYLIQPYPVVSVFSLRYLDVRIPMSLLVNLNVPEDLKNNPKPVEHVFWWILLNLKTLPELVRL